MLRYLYHTLRHFRRVFSRQRSWLLFCAVVLSFLAAPEIMGVTSIGRFWWVGESDDPRLLHFFRAKAYRLSSLYAAWQRYVLNQAVAVEIAGRCVLLGDHPYVIKDGGRMPGGVSLHEHSETQRKPSYFRGQCWGGLGGGVGTLKACFCLPLEWRIHPGFVHRGQAPASAQASRTRLGERVVQMALAFALAQDRPAWRVLDAFFPTAKVFRLARSVSSIALKQPYLHLLVRAKKHDVAYFPAAPKAAHRRGRPPR